jgi:DNA (cytosine-5)-methyltransferase 1
MGWTDSQIDLIRSAGVSNSQQYKQAGNGIVVQVLEAIFRKLFCGGLSCGQ